MRTSKQDNFRVAVQTALLTRGHNGKAMTITELALKVGFSREAVSGAINRGLHAGVRAAVAGYLNLDEKFTG